MEANVESATKKVASKQQPKVVDSSVALGVYKLHENAVIPKFQTEMSACFDLHICLDHTDTVKVYTVTESSFDRDVVGNSITLSANERVLLPTGLVLDIPQGYCLEVYPRSGSSFKLGLGLSNSIGMIDADYTDELFISVINHSNTYRNIVSGDRIAQAKLVPLVETSIAEIKSKPKQKTSRQGGFGSTGKGV